MMMGLASAGPFSDKGKTMSQYTDEELNQRIKKCVTKADFERVIYDGSDGRISRRECTAFVSKLFKLAEEEAQQEKAARFKLYEACAGWAKALVGKA